MRSLVFSNPTDKRTVASKIPSCSRIPFGTSIWLANALEQSEFFKFEHTTIHPINNELMQENFTYGSTAKLVQVPKLSDDIKTRRFRMNFFASFTVPSNCMTIIPE